MRPDRTLALGCLLLAFVVAGCSRQAPTSPSSFEPSSLSRGAGRTAATEQVLSGYLVAYAGRTSTGSQTTFAYVVSGTEGAGTLSHFVIQIPGCAPELASYSPTPASGTIGLDPATGLDGITWGNLSLGEGESGTFSITFPGDVAEGLTRIAVKAGSTADIGVLPGPCGGFAISGTVFDDSDSSGTRDAGAEVGIPNVTVSLVHGDGVIETTTSDLGGHYLFRVIDAGAYTVRIDSSTPASDFNEQLDQSFVATTPASRSVTVGPNQSNVDFGFKPRARKIIADFSVGALVSTGEDDGYWTKALRAAIKGRTFDGLSPAQVLSLLHEIEGSFLPEPYQFTDGNELAEALEIVASRPKTPYEALYKQLFVAELNDASGKGLVGNHELQDVLLAWGESLLVQNQPGATSTSSQFVAAASSTTSDLGDAVELFSMINNSRGGGDIPQ